MERKMGISQEPFEVKIGLGLVILEGRLLVPPDPQGAVIFAQGSGGPHQDLQKDLQIEQAATGLHESGMATLQINLLTPDEALEDQQTLRLRFDMGLLAERLLVVNEWLLDNPSTRELQVGYFATGSGTGAALFAAARQPDLVGAIVSFGGRPDLAAAVLRYVQAPTLLIAGSNDIAVLEINQMALGQLAAEKQLEELPPSSQLLTEQGLREQVTLLARDWFLHHLRPRELERTVGA